MAVIMHHLGGYVAQRTPGLDSQITRESATYQLINVGNYGVQLFFVISGFILTLPFAEKSMRSGNSIRLGKYLQRRFWRLHPPYLINLIALSLSFVAFKQVPWSEIGPHFLASSFYLHNFIYHSMSTINGVAWSLEIEVQFYLLAPLLTLVFRVPSRVFRRCLIMASIAATILLKIYAGSTATYPVTGSVLYYLDYFLCGMLLADWQADSPREISLQGISGTAWDLIGGLSAGTSLAIVLSKVLMPLLPIALLFTVAAALKGSRTNRALSISPFVAFGGMCYSTYLYHFGVISLVGRHVAPWTAGCSYPLALAIQFAITIPAIILVSCAVFLTIEKPFMRRSLVPSAVAN